MGFPFSAYQVLQNSAKASHISVLHTIFNYFRSIFDCKIWLIILVTFILFDSFHKNLGGGILLYSSHLPRLWLNTLLSLVLEWNYTVIHLKTDCEQIMIEVYARLGNVSSSHFLLAKRFKKKLKRQNLFKIIIKQKTSMTNRFKRFLKELKSVPLCRFSPYLRTQFHFEILVDLALL